MPGKNVGPTEEVLDERNRWACALHVLQPRAAHRAAGQERPAVRQMPSAAGWLRPGAVVPQRGERASPSQEDHARGEPGRWQSVSRRRSAAGKSRTAIAGAAGGEAGTGAGARASANGAAGVTDFGAAGSTATPPARRKTKSRRRPAVLADQASLVSSAELAALRARAPKGEPPPAPPGAPAAASAEQPAITDDELRELLPEVCAAAGEMITSRVGCTPLTDKETAP